MIYFIEGSRNSGKSYVSKKISSITGIPRFQYEFSYWFKEMWMEDDSTNSHQFAIGKESMLLQSIRDGIISNRCIIDRGIFSVLSWGVMENRISKEEAEREMDLFIKRGLMSKVKFVYLYGENPNGNRKGKDRWDDKDGDREEEASLMEYFIDYAKNKSPEVSVIKIENKFNESSIDSLKNIIK